MSTAALSETRHMLTLPTDAVRQIQWRFAARFDLQMLVQSARGVARGPVGAWSPRARAITHEWTPAKEQMMEAFDRVGISAIFMEPEEGGSSPGRRTWPSRWRLLSWRG